MTVLSLRFCARAFSSCGEWGPLFIAVRGPLTVAASPAAEHRLQTRRLSSCGSRTQPLRGMWDPPRPGLEPVSPASAGRLSTTAPPGKPLYRLFLILCFSIWILRSAGHIPWKICMNFNWNCMTLMDKFGEKWHLRNIKPFHLCICKFPFNQVFIYVVADSATCLPSKLLSFLPW